MVDKLDTGAWILATRQYGEIANIANQIKTGVQVFLNSRQMASLAQQIAEESKAEQQKHLTNYERLCRQPTPAEPTLRAVLEQGEVSLRSTIQEYPETFEGIAAKAKEDHENVRLVLTERVTCLRQRIDKYRTDAPEALVEGLSEELNQLEKLCEISMPE